jgi:hypothetical protein
MLVSIIPKNQWKSFGTPQYGHLLCVSHITLDFLFLVDEIFRIDQVIDQWLS